MKKHNGRLEVKEVNPNDGDLSFLRRNRLKEYYPVYKVDRWGCTTDEIVGRVVPSDRPGEFLLFPGRKSGAEADEIIRFDHIVRQPASRPAAKTKKARAAKVAKP